MADAGKCVVLVPAYGAIEPECMAGLETLARRGYTVRTLRGASQVDLARSMMATQALDDGFAETLWIDSDTAFDPDDVEKLRKPRWPFMAGLYVRKGKPEFAAKFAQPGTFPFGVGGGQVPMQYVGMGFTLVRAELYRRIESGLGLKRIGGGYEGREIVPYFLPLADGQKGYLSEDYSFCLRARQVGIIPYADTTIRVGHVGRYTYTWDDLFPRDKHDGFSLTIEDPGFTDEPQPENGDDVSAKLYEKIGRQQETIEAQDTNYTALLNVLAAVVNGTIDRSRVMVNLTDRQWVVSEPGTMPTMPSTVNGLPQCVTAPEPELEPLAT